MPSGYASGRNPKLQQVPNAYAPSGALIEVFPRGWVATGNTTALTTQIMTGSGIYLPAGLACTNISYRTATTGNTAPTNWWFALYDTAGPSVVRQSTDQLTAAWAANTTKTLAIDSIPVTAGARVASVVVTLTIPTLFESLTTLVAAGESIVVSNANVAAYNGTFTVDSVTATTIVYTSGSSATDSLVAPFPTVQLPARTRLFRPPASAHYYTAIMFKGTVGTIITVSAMHNSFASVDTPILTWAAGAALTGTAPSPSGALSAGPLIVWAYIS